MDEVERRRSSYGARYRSRWRLTVVWTFVILLLGAVISGVQSWESGAVNVLVALVDVVVVPVVGALVLGSAINLVAALLGGRRGGTEPMQADEGATPRSKRISAARWAAVAFALLIVGSATAGAVSASENTTNRKLLTAVEASEGVMEDYLDRRLSIDREYDGMEPSLGPIYTSQAYEAEVARIQAEYLAETQRAAGTAAKDLYEAGLEIDDVRVMPWQRSISRAKSVYLEHHDAWQRALDSLSDGGQGSTDGAISRTFREACTALERAVPNLGGADDRRRVANICEG